MRPLTKKEKDIVDLAMAGGGDKELAILDKIHSIEDELTALKESIPSLKDIVGSVKGIQGDKGNDGHTPTDAELISLIKPLIPKIQDGKDGKTPTDKELLALIRPLVPKVKDGETPSNERLLALIRPLIPEPVVIDQIALVDAVEAKLEANLPAFGQAFRDALELLPEGEKLSPDAIEGLQKSLEEIVSKEGARKGWGAHPLTIQQSGTTKAKNARFLNFTGAAVTQNASGVTTIAITAGGFATPTGTVNGVNTVFATTFDPEYVLADGMIRIEGFGYSYAAGSITMDIAPADFIRYA